MPKYLLIVVFCCLFFGASAQETFKGQVFENKTRSGINSVYIENLNNKQSTLTDKNGKFAVKAKLGDLVLFKSIAYQNDTVLVTSYSNTEIFLDLKKIQLNEVNITTTGLAKEAPKYDKLFHNQSMVYHRNKEGNYDGGVTFRIKYWKKGEKDKAKLAKKLQDFDTMDHIHEVFVPETIGKYVPLKDEELDNFISLYTPSVKVYTDKDFNLVSYLSDCYKKYEALPPEKRKPEPIVN
ncbi:peptidase associated/transthyretin-like domain-containing protein [Mucilaginibacter pedocola]|uniref:TonB-dependent receptor n=1 Tax=Mucilaginibacter pedocola TaxID=1792845 RepID=A0A1S9PE26_9SPHI|nr:hypothetical protein [Mucilaginibacter pedocola]OOQ59201.1 hypothetical protein BC343_28995 [Mucilaginibacter pedocola]